jgi:protein-S-isoprenylcysteine O-methyltransferase Ste14
METGSETTFRLATLVLLVLGFVVRRWYQRAVDGAERASARRERLELGLYRLVFASFLFVFVYALSPFLDFAHLALPPWLRWTGAVVAASGSALLGWTHRTLGRNWSGVLEIHTDHALVTEGPYRHVRHPMYSSFFLSGIGLLLLTANALVGVVNLGAILVMYVLRSPAEEAMMVEHFGDEYRAYMQRTGRLVPRLRTAAARPLRSTP